MTTTEAIDLLTTRVRQASHTATLSPSDWAALEAIKQLPFHEWRGPVAALFRAVADRASISALSAISASEPF